MTGAALTAAVAAPAPAAAAPSLVLSSGALTYSGVSGNEVMDVTRAGNLTTYVPLTGEPSNTPWSITAPGCTQNGTSFVVTCNNAAGVVTELRFAMLDGVNSLFAAGVATAPIKYTGGSGSDSFVGGALADTADGGDGDDSLAGENGGDTLTGGNGADTLIGADGGDTLNGGEGIDLALGGPGTTTSTSAATATRGSATRARTS